MNYWKPYCKHFLRKGIQKSHGIFHFGHGILEKYYNYSATGQLNLPWSSLAMRLYGGMDG
jgi:hypothetical protein